MGLLPRDLDILPPSDDRVFKLILPGEQVRPCVHGGGLEVLAFELKFHDGHL